MGAEWCSLFMVANKSTNAQTPMDSFDQLYDRRIAKKFHSFSSRLETLLTLLLFSFFVRQYINKSASVVRSALKEPAKRKAMAEERFSYKASTWEAGQQGTKTEITTLTGAGSV